MPHARPKDTDFALWELDVLDRDCPACRRMMHICDHRYRHFYTLDGPVELACRLNHCPDPGCPGRARTKSPEVEPTIALPGWGIAWDVFCWIGHRRFARHWSIPQIRGELHDRFAIDLTEPGIANYLRRYQAMLAARQHDPDALRRHYQGAEALILSIDGLQPEKGHEALYVVRELTGKRVWFAEPLLSATAAEVRRLITRAKDWADALGKSGFSLTVSLDGGGPYPLWRNQARLSPGRIARRASPVAAISPSTVRAAADRSAALSLLNSRSIGLRSGLYAGRYRTQAPASAISCATAAVLWHDRLSMMTMSPGRSAGARQCST